MARSLAHQSGRILRWAGGATSALALGSLVAVRAFGGADGPDALAALGRGVLFASLAMMLTLLAAVGFGLLVAGVALGADPRPRAALAPAPRLPLTDDE